jgi:hypothetical protein
MGVLITRDPATAGMQDAIDHGGVFTHPANKQTFPTLLPYIPAAQREDKSEEHKLFEL